MEQHRQIRESMLTGMLYCLAGSLFAGSLSAGVLVLLVLLLN